MVGSGEVAGGDDALQAMPRDERFALFMPYTTGMAVGLRQVGWRLH